MLQSRLTLLLLSLVGLAFLTAQPASLGQEKLDPEVVNKKRTLELLDKAKDEYRIFFKKPETPIEFWSAIKFEMDLGKFDLAALHLKLLLEKQPPEDTDKELVKLEAAEGMSAFLRLRRVRQWSDHPPFQKEAEANVESLLNRVTEAVHKHLSDPVRNRKFINQLGAATPEERAFAYVQIARARERAVPYLIEALRINYGKPLFPKLRETMLRIGPETVPVYLEVFKAANEKDYRDIELRGTLLDIIRERDDKRVIPYLWHLHASKKYPDVVRAKAKETLASLLRIEVSEVPPAKESLTYLAERYYQHKIPFDGKDVLLWEWDGEGIKPTPDKLTPASAEKFFSERYAREALDLDPGFHPAQIVLLSMVLERYYRPETDQFLLKPMPPKMQQLLTTIDADLAMRVLERAMDDRQTPVILPLVVALGDRGEQRAARVNEAGQMRGLARALYYPDRRVQFAAMTGMVRMPPGVLTPSASDRVVDLSRRFLASEMEPKALIVYAPPGQEQSAREAVKGLGYESVTAKSAVDAVNKGRASADFDLVVLHRGMADQDFPVVYSRIRKEYDLGGLPMIVIVEKAREKTVKKLLAKDANVVVVTEDKFQGDDLKAALETAHKNAQIVKLKAEERKLFAQVSMDMLWRMSRGEYKGYDLSPAVGVLMDQLRSPEYALPAVEILGRMPGKEIQYNLAGIVTDPGRDKLRLPAVFELNRHIQANGLALDKKQLAELKSAHEAEPEGSPLRSQLNVTMSMIARPTLAKTGADLFKFRPDPPAPVKEEKKDN